MTKLPEDAVTLKRTSTQENEVSKTTETKNLHEEETIKNVVVVINKKKVYTKYHAAKKRYSKKIQDEKRVECDMLNVLVKEV
jgi:hypothetical protein